MSFSTCEAVSIDVRHGIKKPTDVNSIELPVSLYVYFTIPHFVAYQLQL